MKQRIQERVEAFIPGLSARQVVILLVGAATFFFGFGAAAILNAYLLAIQSPLVTTLRSSLNFQSAVFGDGIVLPIVNMFIAAYLLRNSASIGKKTKITAVIFGLVITAYFHINQAVNGLVNWTMPEPWQWNILGVWHAGYMFSVATFISLFYLILLKKLKTNKRLPKEAFIVTLGILIFLILLRLDYMTVSFSALLPRP